MERFYRVPVSESCLDRLVLEQGLGEAVLQRHVHSICARLGAPTQISCVFQNRSGKYLLTMSLIILCSPPDCNTKGQP